MVTTPVTTERYCVSSSPVKSFVLHICSEILKRKKWLKDPELRWKKMEWTRHIGLNNHYDFIVYYALVNDGNKVRDFKIELNIKECGDGLEGDFVAKAITEGLRVKGQCFAIFNRLREIQSAHLILE